VKLLLAALGFFATGTALAQVPQVVVTEERAEVRVVEHALGTTQVPLEPQRVVSLAEPVTDNLLALGVQPVGTVVTDAGTEIVNYLQPQLAGVAVVGTLAEPNLEVILSLAPDLILADSGYATEAYEQLSRVAPTVYLTEPYQDVRRNLRELGRVLGMPEAAEARVAEYDAVLAEARDALAEAVGGASVVFLRVRNDRDLLLYGTETRFGEFFYEDLGLEPIPLAVGGDFLRPSLETVPQLTADHIFVSVESGGTMRVLGESTLWQNLPAAQNGRIYPVDENVWVDGAGVQAFELRVQDVLGVLTDANAGDE